MNVQELEKLHDDILIGNTKIEDVSDENLLLVGRHKIERHRCGFSVCLKSYLASPQVFFIADKEITRRRKERIGK